jgi:hypothetical protein
MEVCQFEARSFHGVSGLSLPLNWRQERRHYQRRNALPSCRDFASRVDHISGRGHAIAVKTVVRDRRLQSAI